jgi:alkanesulfonate monooxygenase SsuD/methylene tetrahydromethanopterin reductase-like flavin-dependent oxidoreductase (luciferase family)
MRTGLMLVFQNGHESLSDGEMVRNEVRLAELADPLGFDVVWSVEHHFDDYAMCPDNTQLLSYLAARTERIELGTAAVILPWNNPLRVVEKMILLDHLSGGRAVFGMGRGLARMEYAGFGMPMDEARPRFDEAAKMILEGLETGFVEGKGPFYPQARTEVRPKPLRSFRGRTYCVAMSPDTIPVAAELGARMMFFAQFPMEQHLPNVQRYRQLYVERHGKAPSPPLPVDFMYCDEDAGRAEEKARRHIAAYFVSVMRHYEMMADHFGRARGYEGYAGIRELLRSSGKEKSAEGYVDVQVWGTPQQILDRIERRTRILGEFELNVCASYAGLPYPDVERSMRLFAREVLPEVRSWTGPGASEAHGASA